MNINVDCTSKVWDVGLLRKSCIYSLGQSGTLFFPMEIGIISVCSGSAVLSFDIILVFSLQMVKWYGHEYKLEPVAIS